MPDTTHTAPLCVIAMGGNTGDPAACFRRAVESLKRGGFCVRRVSSFYATAPEGMAPGTPDFLNAVLSGYWPDTPHRLLDLCQRIEAENGRPSDHARYVSRTLDLDIILFGKEKIADADLVIPHPLASRRDFVKIPLREIEPDLLDLL